MGLLNYSITAKRAGLRMIFTNSRDLFYDLWQEWRDTKLIQRAMETPMQGMDYDEIFNCLSEQEQKERTDRKKDFVVVAGIELEVIE